MTEVNVPIADDDDVLLAETLEVAFNEDRLELGYVGNDSVVRRVAEYVTPVDPVTGEEFEVE